jgi:hypothetical protein
MATSLLRFIWVSFREYWGVWVTGTGLMGLLLFLLNLMQNVSGWKMKPRHYLIVLFCTFWFLATFSAWRDADRNLQSVIAQRTKDTGDLGKCSGNLQTQTALKESWQERYADQQKTINAFQGPQFQQQATLNSCVVSLGKLNPIVNTNTGVILPSESVSHTGL